MNISKTELYNISFNDLYDKLLDYKVIQIVKKNTDGKETKVFRASIDKPRNKARYPKSRDYSKVNRKGYEDNLELLKEIGNKALEITGTHSRQFYIYK